VFPVSDKARDVTDALRRYMQAGGVTVLRERAAGLSVSDGAVMGVRTESDLMACGKVILATGGLSYPATGSTGDGYAFASACGHTVVEPRASLVPLEAVQTFCASMQGLSLRNVAVSLRDETGKNIYTDFGELLFTHFGVSGPVILSASAVLRDMDKHRYHLLIDLKPALDEKKLDARILRDFEKYANRDFANALSDLLHRLMIPVIIELSEIPPDTKVNGITKQQRRRLLELLKGFRVDVAGPRPIREAVVTAGGVSVKEINAKTMESRLIRGLYFAGEIIDVDALTGGYNLQIAWSTGYAAGSAAGSADG